MLDELVTRLVREAVRAELEPLLERVGAQPAPDPLRLLTKAELALRLQVSERTIDSMRGKGLPVVWVIESPRFDWIAVREWLAAQPCCARSGATGELTKRGTPSTRPE